MAYSRMRPGPNCSPRSGTSRSKDIGLFASALGSSSWLHDARASAIPAFMILSLLLVAVAASVAMLTTLSTPAASSTIFDANHTSASAFIPLLVPSTVRLVQWNRRTVVSVPIHVDLFVPTNISIRGRWLAVMHPAMFYGGEDNKSIRFMMEDEPPLEEPPLERPPLSEEAEQWVAQVANVEKRQIEALDNVARRVYFTYGDKANENKAWAELWCCWLPSRRSFKHISVSCDETFKPSLLEAVQQLHAIILKEHACASHVHNGHAVERRARVEGDHVEKHRLRPTPRRTNIIIKR